MHACPLHALHALVDAPVIARTKERGAGCKGRKVANQVAAILAHHGPSPTQTNTQDFAAYKSAVTEIVVVVVVVII